MERTTEELLHSLIGMTIESIELDGEQEPASATITLNRGSLMFEGEDLSLNIDVSDLQ
jgi:hypothetical protein